MTLRQLPFTYLPAIHTAFASQPIGLRKWRTIIGAALVFYSFIELDKWMRRRRSLNGAQHKEA